MVRFRTKTVAQTTQKCFGAIALLAGLLVLPACANNDNTASEYSPDEESIEEVSEEPVDYIGETVTLAGQVQNTYGDDLFVIEDEEFFGDESVLVLNQNPGTQPPVGDDYVQVTGEVREFLVADIEREYGLEIDPDAVAELEVEYEGQPVVVANSIEPISEEMAEEMDG